MDWRSPLRVPSTAASNGRTTVLNGFGWPHILIIAVLIIILFGAKRLPDAARGIGKSMRIFRAETRGLHEDDAAANGQANGQQMAPPQQLSAPFAPPQQYAPPPQQAYAQQPYAPPPAQQPYAAPPAQPYVAPQQQPVAPSVTDQAPVQGDQQR
ncbi:MAG TPA: Sec-independent protein translocase subunit TatA [Pseudonocardiaceae bacterium]|nr:Sec-independent protein translocase subunit TatA [Pseudonocardiaceae bacterium]